ncbi:MAG TPA: sensor histidine kinase [Candidatus Nitrosocosmicus sp.]|nr:sensor histidine kinase [Candidatus Nitrosocosmicus sp.]
MGNWAKELAIKYHRLKISAKIVIYYALVLSLSLLISYLLYNTLISGKVNDEISSTSMQTLQAIDKNLEFMLNNVEQLSNLVFYDKSIQDALRNVDADGIDPQVQWVLNKYLANIVLSGDIVSSAYVFDNYSNRYAMGTRAVSKLAISNIEDSPVYDRIIELQGGLMWEANSAGILENTSGNNYISLLRVINDVTTMKKLATLIVNVNEETIQEEFADVGKKYKSQFFIMDSKGNYIINPTLEDRSYEEYLIPMLDNDHGYTIRNIGTRKMLISFVTSKYSNWKIIGIMPISEIYKELKDISYIAVIIILINSIFISLGALYITKLVTQPLARMQGYMKSAERGEFAVIPVEEHRDDEIIQLKKVYNKMVVEIEKLIARVKKEERTKRKNELKLIQAQIKPHFLYNTLDAISALSLMGDSQNAYKITRSLGDFYRTSLSNGNETITVKEELDCIKSYLSILDIRYDGKYAVDYEIDPEIADFKILKLLLQPIVENAVHHGLRNKEGEGLLSIIGYRAGESLIFKIKDNGIGMTGEKINEVLNNKVNNTHGGFGIYSCKQRLSIYYNTENPLRIESTPGMGTEVTVEIPVMGEDLNVN